MKSGRRRVDPSAICIAFSPSFESGRLFMALSTRLARFSWWDSSARIGWMPRCARESAVTFSRKWILALFSPETPRFFSTIATEVSSLLRTSRVSNLTSHEAEGKSPHHDVSIARVSRPRRFLENRHDALLAGLRKDATGALKQNIGEPESDAPTGRKDWVHGPSEPLSAALTDQTG